MFGTQFSRYETQNVYFIYIRYERDKFLFQRGRKHWHGFWFWNKLEDKTANPFTKALEKEIEVQRVLWEILGLQNFKLLGNWWSDLVTGETLFRWENHQKYNLLYIFIVFGKMLCTGHCQLQESGSSFYKYRPYVKHFNINFLPESCMGLWLEFWILCNNINIFNSSQNNSSKFYFAQKWRKYCSAWNFLLHV